MDKRRKEDIKRHIATHTVRSAEDRSAVSYLESVINPGGRINTAFSCDDKWPNHDGCFEYVSNPDLSRYPEQNFIVQIKGTHQFYIDVDNSSIRSSVVSLVGRSVNIGDGFYGVLENSK